MVQTPVLLEAGNSALMKTYSRYPVVFEHGKGARLWDVDGKSYLDLVAGIAVNVLGHAHPRLVKAISEQAAQLIHVSNLYFTKPQIDLAQTLIAKSFADAVFFSNSGAEANEGAVKLARKFFSAQNLKTPRFEVITMTHSFHGRTLGMISATGQEKVKKGFDPLLEGFVHVPFGDFEALRKAIGPKTAAVMLEPIQGEGGIHVASSDYLKAVRNLCDSEGILLIYDEIQTGVGRTGKFFAYEHSGVVPDILTLAKGLAGGVPIGALLATEKVASAFYPGTHASTFGGNPLATRAALEVVAVLDEGLLAHAEQIGAYFKAGLDALHQQFPQKIKAVRGAGLMLGLELFEPAAVIVTAALSEGLLLNAVQENTLRFVPPLVISKLEVDEALGHLARLLAKP